MKEKYGNRGYAVNIEVPSGGKDWNEVLLNRREATKHNKMIVNMDEETIQVSDSLQESRKESSGFQKKLREIDKTSRKFAFYYTMQEKPDGGKTYHRSIISHLTDEGSYDYSILDEKFRLLDGGELDSIDEVLNGMIPEGMTGTDIVPKDFLEVTEKNDMVEEVLLHAKKSEISFSSEEMELFTDYTLHHGDTKKGIQLFWNLEHTKKYHPDWMEQSITGIYERINEEKKQKREQENNVQSIRMNHRNRRR